MPGRLVLLIRWIALAVLVLAIVLIIARWKLPMREQRSRGVLDVLRGVWRAWRERKEDAREHAEDLSALRGKTALLIGPEDRAIRVIQWRLEGAKCHVLRTRTGTQALQLYRDRGADLVVADALLPDMSAVDFYDALGESRKPVAFLGVLRQQWDELHRLGRNVICSGAPVDPEEIAAAAGYMLRGRTL